MHGHGDYTHDHDGGDEPHDHGHQAEPELPPPELDAAVDAARLEAQLAESAAQEAR